MSLLLVQGTSNAQNQNNQWRFGFAAGVAFLPSGPIATAPAALATGEGSASIANPVTGALMFYTDGVTIWTALNQPMPNGTGLLGGVSQLSSTTAAVIVPRPLTPNQYYVFTIDEQFSNNGFRYSLVDMTLNNGLGDVVTGQKNIPLLATLSEKIHAVPSSDGCGYWVITHQTVGNTFNCYKVTQAGVQLPPVLSTIGSTQGNGAGHMKVSPQFNKLAMGSFFANTVELYDFNNTTGVVSNLVSWNFSFPNGLLYGVEFSPNGNLLYVSNLFRIIQYDITLATATQIQNSAYEVSFGTSGIYSPASLQLGPNNKIYAASGGLDVINNPNSPGFACGFQTNILTLQGSSNYGLPQKVYLLGQTAPNAITFSDSCLQSVINFTLADTTGVISYSWNFGDPASGTQNTSNLVQPSHQFTQSGSFHVTAVLNKGCFSDTVKTTVNVVNCQVISPAFTGLVFSGDTCEVGTSFSWNVNGSTGSSFFSWNFGDPSSGASNLVLFSGQPPFPPANHVFSGPGIYNVCLTYQEPGQPARTTCRLVRIGLCCRPRILVTDTCVNNATRFRLAGADTLRTASWFFGDQAGTGTAQQLSPTFVYSEPGFYNVEVTFVASCGQGKVNRLIEVINCRNDCELSFPNVVTPNGDGLNDTWKIVQQCPVQNYSLTVFNRWGRPVFKSNDAQEAWKPVNEEGGTYYYKLSLIKSGGENLQEEFKGWIQMVR